MVCLCKKESHLELLGIPYDPVTMPRPCWLYANDNRYKALFDGKETPSTAVPPNPSTDDNRFGNETENTPITHQVKPPTLKLPTPPKQEYPSIVNQTFSFATATIDWVAQGKPTRTDEECQTIHKICEACPEFDAPRDRCKKCGCGLSINASTAWIYSIGIPDGIKMATHHCPIGKW